MDAINNESENIVIEKKVVINKDKLKYVATKFVVPIVVPVAAAVAVFYTKKYLGPIQDVNVILPDGYEITKIQTEEV